MLGLVCALGFAGYLLVYAAVANGGKFAAAPWEALRGSAYGGDAGSGGAAASSSSGGSGGVIGAGKWVIDHVPFLPLP